MHLTEYSNSLRNSELLLDLGLQPVSNRFIESGSSDIVPHYPLKLMLNKETGLVHVAKPFPVEDLKPRFDWITCFEPEDHLDELVENIINLPNINTDSSFAGFSFKDRSTLERLEGHGYSNQWVIDPKVDLGVLDTLSSIETHQAEFTISKADSIKKHRGLSDVFILRHVLEHAENTAVFLEAAKKLIKSDGYLVLEVPDCEKGLTAGDPTIIWEEHTCYFTGFSFQYLLELAGFDVLHYQCIPYPFENSIVAIVRKNTTSEKIRNTQLDNLDLEIKRARSFRSKISRRRHSIRSTLERFQTKNMPIALFGAGHLAVTFLSIMKIEHLIEFVIDDNPYKHGMRFPISNLEIFDSRSLYNKKVGLCLLGLNPQNQPQIIKKHNQFIENGGIFASIFPGSNIDLALINDEY